MVSLNVQLTVGESKIRGSTLPNNRRVEIPITFSGRSWHVLGFSDTQLRLQDRLRSPIVGPVEGNCWPELSPANNTPS